MNDAKYSTAVFVRSVEVHTTVPLICDDVVRKLVKAVRAVIC